MMAEKRVRRLFYSDEYGLTFVSVDYTWDSTLERYVSHIDTVVGPSDVPFIRTKKEYFLKEINIMKTIPLLPSLKAIICHLLSKMKYLCSYFLSLDHGYPCFL